MSTGYEMSNRACTAYIEEWRQKTDPVPERISDGLVRSDTLE